MDKDTWEKMDVQQRQDYLQEMNQLVVRGIVHRKWPKHLNNDDDSPPEFVVNTIRRSDERIGRNDFCPCGSEKKFKKCCLSVYNKV